MSANHIFSNVKNGEFGQKKNGSQGTNQFLKKPTQIRSLYQDLELIDN